MKLLKGCWYGLMAASWFAGRITGRREFFLLLFIMGFVLLYTLGLNIWTGRSFCYLQEVEKKVCVKGDQTFLHVSITNDKPFPFSLIRLTMVPVARSQIACERFSLLPSSSINFKVPVHCPYRGIHKVGMTTLEINDSFGLVRTNFNMPELPYYRHIEVKVYPQLTQLGALPARGSDSRQIGNVGVWRMEQGESYAGLRPYRPGDPFKRVHRAVSARRREWYVRTYDLPFETSILIVLDTAAAFDSEEEGLYLGDLACQCAAAIAHFSLKTGYRVTYLDAGIDSILTLDSVDDFPKLNNRLAELCFEKDGGGLDGFPRLGAGQLSAAQAAYIISARTRGGIQEALAPLGAVRSDIKLIAVGTRASASLWGNSNLGLPAANGVQTIPIMVGDDVAAVLAP